MKIYLVYVGANAELYREQNGKQIKIIHSSFAECEQQARGLANMGHEVVPLVDAGFSWTPDLSASPYAHLMRPVITLK